MVRQICRLLFNKMKKFFGQKSKKAFFYILFIASINNNFLRKFTLLNSRRFQKSACGKIGYEKKNANLNKGATMSEQEKKAYRELVNFYKTHKWVQQENGRWIMVYNPLVKLDDQEGGN